MINEPEDVSFQKQLDELAIWFENWSHLQRCGVLKRLISISNFPQFQLLWTAVEPILHRDFMYSASERFPSEQFTPISTEISRATRQRLTKNRMIQRFHRTKSAYIRTEEDVMSRNHLLPPIESKPFHLPAVEAGIPSSFIRIPSLHHRRSLTTPDPHVDHDHRKPEANWMTAMHVRRHILENPVVENASTCSSDSSCPNSDQLLEWYASWKGPERATFLRLALMKLDARQLYFLSSFLAVRRHRDMLSLLPPNVAHHILSFLPPTDLISCAKVSKSWETLCRHNKIWRQKCDETPLHVRPVATPSVGGWRSAYREDKLLKRNWREGICSELELTGHSGGVLCVVANDKMIVSGGKDATVRVWSASSGRLKQTFTGHQKSVWCVAILTDKLVASGSYDRCVKIWRLGAKAECLRTLFGHLGPIWCMVCKQRYLATGSQDRMIKLWDIHHCTLLRTLRGHTSAIFAMDADDCFNNLFSGSADKSIRVWEIATGQCIRVLWTGSATATMSVSFSHGLLASAAGGHVMLWEPISGRFVRSFHPHKERIESVQLRITDSTATSGVLTTASKDGVITYWGIFGNEIPIRKLRGHKGQINCVTSGPTRVVSASHDGTVRVWDFRESPFTPITPNAIF
nr:F-box/WD repeat-containing protein 7 isoform X1 [Ciona intestinalis]XP_026696631.1 F-box/WD repeat-containing protein 7 isoform X1 [Ciona intestinalis]XP_026696633.1 F-box/WD repeat-containing protein 7 isoform X1 [Ciona intestinalis]|eukprot:XP_018673256.1 F-box/WD repeat-containing protein 7 isoform X1 [Ciona intestinalis]